MLNINCFSHLYSENPLRVARLIYRDYESGRDEGEKPPTQSLDRERMIRENREFWGILTQGTAIENEFLQRYDLGELMKPREELQQGPSKTPTIRLRLNWGTVDIRLQEDGKLTALGATREGFVIFHYYSSNDIGQLVKRLQEYKKHMEAFDRAKEFWNYTMRIPQAFSRMMDENGFIMRGYKLEESGNYITVITELLPTDVDPEINGMVGEMKFRITFDIRNGRTEIHSTDGGEDFEETHYGHGPTKCQGYPPIEKELVRILQERIKEIKPIRHISRGYF